MTDDFMVNSMPFMFSTDLLRSFLELIIIDWNLSKFTTMLFGLNQFIPLSHSFYKISKSLVKSSPPTSTVLPTAKFASSASLNTKDKLFIKKIKENWSKNRKKTWKKLSISFTLTLRFLHFKACVRYFHQILIFQQTIALQKLWKMLFISSKKLFLFSKYSIFCISVLPSFSTCRPLL